jgi:hypothetical protein
MKPTNFHVIINQCEAGGVRNDGTGVLQLPGIAVGRRLLDWTRDRGKIVIEGRKIRLYQKRAQADTGGGNQHEQEDDLDIGDEEFERQTLKKIGHLEKTPYINPDIQEKRQEIIDTLSYRALCIYKVVHPNECKRCIDHETSCKLGPFSVRSTPHTKPFDPILRNMKSRTKIVPLDGSDLNISINLSALT